MGSPRKKDLEDADQDKNKQKGQDNGVTEDRSCTDILPCCLFLVWIIAMIAVTGYVTTRGDISNIFIKFDMDGNECGQSDQNNSTWGGQLHNQDMTNYPKKYFTNLVALDQTKMHYSICVKECPEKIGTKLECQRNTEISECPQVQYDTQDMMGYCVPTTEMVQKIGQSMFDAMTAQMNKQIGGFSKYMADLTNSWRLLCLMSFISLLITLFYLFLLRWITKPLLYTSLFLIFICGAAVSYLCWNNSKNFDKETDQYKYSIAGACVAGVLTILYVVFLCCQWKNIAIGASIMGAAGEFVAMNSRIAILPPIAYLLCIPVFLWFIYTNIFLYSLGTPKYVKKDMFATLEPSKQENIIFWCFLFGFFWMIAFIISIQQFTIACTACLWYFSGQGSDTAQAKNSVDVRKGVKWAFRYHLGSLAFGSMLIAITTMIKFLFEYFVKKYESLAAGNVIMKVVICCIRGCVWCLDSCVKFMSENAYIQVALNGTSFCEGAQNAFYMMIRNPGTFTASNIVGWIMTGIGKGVIVGFSTLLTMVFVDKKILSEKVMQPFVPAFCIFLFSWVIASLFLSIFDFACLAILQCFIQNKEMGGTVNTPDSLKDFIDKEDDKYAKRKDNKKEKQNHTTNTIEVEVNKMN